MTYKQSTGELFNGGGALLGRGYSGNGPALNDPGSDHIHDHGPIPRGQFTIGAPTNEKGPLTLPLTPIPAPDLSWLHGRAGFLIHGDNAAMNHTASEGCIIMGHDVRAGIAAGGDRHLVVVA